MNTTSILSRADLLNATAKRFQKKFGKKALQVSETIDIEGNAPRTRHESLRARLEPRSSFELLQSNPSNAVERRLARLGFSKEITLAHASERLELAAGLDLHRIGLERIIGRSELLSIRYLDQGQRAGFAVARVVIRNSSDDILGYGTGSMISPNLFMTNNHVLPSTAVAGNSIVEFNYQLGFDGNELAKVSFRLRPELFFTTSPEDSLDVSIVAVSSTPILSGAFSLSHFGFNPLTATGDEILAGEGVTIIQHPGGDLKQIALRENRVLQFPDTVDQFLYYETDTTPGSSGAPVFNDQWEVVALHHSGFPERNSQGQYMTTDGQVWKEEMGEDRIHWIANEGIRVKAIREHLQSIHNLTSAQGQLRDLVLNPSQLNETQPQIQAIVSGSPSVRIAQISPTTNSWTIPLTITVNVGTPGIATVPAQPTTDSLSEGGFNAAIAEANRAGTRVYYDATSDRLAATAYFSSVDANLTPAKLYEALSKIVSDTHTNKLGYDPKTHLYPWVDLHRSLKITSIYSSQSFTPLELIARDREVARLRSERLARFKSSEAANSEIALAELLESLEIQLAYNCEHVVPQSWFKKKQPMKGDLHHLFACESVCNSFRGNTPYFDFPDFREGIRSDCGRSDPSKFEPNSGKGPVARATLYFLLRYPGEINASANEYTAERLKVILTWHKDHPITEYELHRNEAIFTVQGNRNPLIDRPEWAEKIDFAKGLG